MLGNEKWNRDASRKIEINMKLLLLRDYDLILIVCDRFSKMSYFITITERITVKVLAKLLRDNM